ncbi:Rv0361 family membrane protein [Nocardia brevicatena]|uniref:Rv0361 family membrane protein n=1 Tax=Nocardia brevicatena TaxID=37327 RepID=UPI001FE20505|nr:nuclear transport factor 2 family protein [Nocardia brevicatena]
MSHPNDDKNPKRASNDREPSAPDDQRRAPSAEQGTAIDTPEPASGKPDADTSDSGRVGEGAAADTSTPSEDGTANEAETARAREPKPNGAADADPNGGPDEDRNGEGGHADDSPTSEAGLSDPGAEGDPDATERGGDAKGAEATPRTGTPTPDSEQRGGSEDTAESDGSGLGTSPGTEKGDPGDTVADGDSETEVAAASGASDTETGEDESESPKTEEKPVGAETESVHVDERADTAASAEAVPLDGETTSATETSTEAPENISTPEAAAAAEVDTDAKTSGAPEADEDVSGMSEPSGKTPAPSESSEKTSTAPQPDEKTPAAPQPSGETPAASEPDDRTTPTVSEPEEETLVASKPEDAPTVAPPGQAPDNAPTERVDMADLKKAVNRQPGERGTAGDTDKARPSDTATGSGKSAAAGPDAKTERISLAQRPNAPASPLSGQKPENAPTERINMADLKKAAPKRGGHRPADTSGRGGTGPDAKTQKIPAPRKSDDPPTTAMPAQKPENAPTERINMADLKKAANPGEKAPGGTDRVDAGTRRPLAKPPSTPRSTAGPRQPGPQGPSGPDQRGPRPGGGQPPARHPAPPRPVGGAPSPADTKPTVADQRVGTPGLAPPQRVQPDAAAAPPAPGRPKRWLLAVAAAAALVLVLIVVAVMVGSEDDSPQAQIRAVIGDYTRALTNGDLAALQSATCGELHDYYQGMSAEQFDGVHRQAKDEGTLPVVTGVDAIQITGDTALAQATVKGENNQENSARTFDLQRTEDGWKVCEPTSGTP